MIAALLVGLAASNPFVAAYAVDGARPAAKVIGAYFPGGAAARYPISRIPADRLTHLFYAFATIDEGRCVSPGAEAGAHFAALAELKRRHPGLRTLISIGGWNAGGFSDAASTARSRRRFVASCMALFFDTHRGSFDGVDIDWEFPVYGGPPEIGARAQDRRNMTLLAREFRRQLLALGKKRGQQSFLLTAALPAGRLQSAGPYDPARSYELAELAEVLDFINLMTYDMGTGFSAVSSFNAPLNEVAEDPLGQPMRRWNNVVGAIDYYQQHGVPAHKLVLGVPFYGRGSRVSSEASHGLYQPYTETFDPGSLAGHQEHPAARSALGAALASGGAVAVAVPSWRAEVRQLREPEIDRDPRATRQGPRPARRLHVGTRRRRRAARLVGGDAATLRLSRTKQTRGDN